MDERNHSQHPMSRADTAVVGFLAGYSSTAIVAAYGLDLRLLFEWCAVQGLDPLEVTRTHLELFARHLEDDRGIPGIPEHDPPPAASSLALSSRRPARQARRTQP